MTKKQAEIKQLVVELAGKRDIVVTRQELDTKKPAVVARPIDGKGLSLIVNPSPRADRKARRKARRLLRRMQKEVGGRLTEHGNHLKIS